MCSAVLTQGPYTQGGIVGVLLSCTKQEEDHDFRETTWSLTLDILMLSCALLIIVLKAFFFFIKRSTSSHSVLYSDNSLEFYVRLDCSSLEDAEVLLSFCGSTSFHSEQIIPHFQDKSSSGKSESIDYAPVTVGTGAYANHSAPV